MKSKRSLFTTVLMSALVCAAMLTAPTPAQAAQDDLETLVNMVGTSTNMAGSAATNLTGYGSMYVGQQDTVGVQISQVYDQAGTAASVYYFQRSLDNVRWDSTLIPVGITGTGNTMATVLTNLPTQSARFMRCTYATNGSAAAVNVTNIIIKWGQKNTR
jgi:hypothetical protein